MVRISDENEEKIRASFQKFAEEDKTAPVVKSLLAKANERNMPLLDCITETGPEIREIFDRMLLAEIQWQQSRRKPTQ